MSIRSKLMATFVGMSLLIGLVALIAVNRQFVAGEAAAVAEAQDAARIIANAIADAAPTDAPSQALDSHSLWLQEYVAELQQRLDRHVVVVDRDERILANAGHGVLGPVYDLDPHDEIAQTISDGIPRTFAETDLSHPEYNLHVVVPLPTGTGADTLGAVILDYSHSYQEMRSIASRSLTIVVAVASAGVLLSLALSYRVSRSIAGPLAQLSAAFARVAAGQDDARVEVRSRDEIGSLTRGFNAMVDDLNQSRSRLERQAAELTRKYEELSEEVDKRKRAETQLSEQEEAYRTLAENLPGIVFRLHLRGDQRMEFFSRVALSMIGSDSNELGKGQICPCESLMVSEDRAKVATAVEQAIITNQPYSVEYRWTAANGELRHMLERGTPVQGADGEPLFVDGVILDITEQKRSEEVLWQQAQIINQIHDAVIATDLAGYVTSWNQGAERLTGYAEAEALGKHISFLYPEDLREFLEEGVIAPLKAKGAHETEVRMRRKSGKDLYAHLSLSLLRDGAGAATGMIGYSMDITAGKRAEQLVQQHIRRLETLRKIDRAILTVQSPAEVAAAVLHHLRELLEHCSGVNLVLFDLENQSGTVLAVDAGRQTEFGPGTHLPLDLAGDLQDLRQDKVYLIDDARTIAQLSPALRIMLPSGLRSYMCVPLVVQDDLVGSLNLRSDLPSAFTPEDVEVAREVAGPLAIAIQQNRLAEQVRQSHKRLRALSRRLVEAQEEERRRLARELHDEIGQALTAVKISLQTAQRRADMGVAGNQLEESVAIVDRALQQVRDVSLDLRPSLLDDLGLVATLRWYLDRHSQSGELRISLQVEPPDLHLPSELEVIVFRVVQEALTNVMRHAWAQNVEVKLQRHEEAVELMVRDDGVGFDLQDALENAMAGTSMGLLGMQERVSLAGGHIDIVSAPGRGTEIRVRFPMVP